jgi:GTPase SAR1 family protein
MEFNEFEWNEKQKVFISKIEKSIDAFEHILAIDSDNYVLSDQRREIKSSINHNKTLLAKLKNKECTIAVVGLEKAGKSTLGNALLENSFLPEYTERCTYTTTEIKAGLKNIGTVEFYTKEEFQENFAQLLQFLKYEGNFDYSLISGDEFETWWQDTHVVSNSEIYQLYNGTIHNDILAMLAGRQRILSLLGTDPKVYEGIDQLDSSEFTVFITGMKYGSNGLKTSGNGPEPYAVKKVSIESPKFEKMKNVILYDVPGFDSPTKLHKAQTEQMLRKADVIILVTNVGDRPDLNGPQIDMLCKSVDEDGILLHDKSFVFGNKLDMAGNAVRAADNIEALCREVEERYDIARRERVICGSAKAYLEKIGKVSKDEKARGGIDACKNLDEWNMGDGIKELSDAMVNYYSNERFEIIQQRVENSLKKTRGLLENILEIAKTKLTTGISDTGALALRAKKNINKFKSVLQDYIKTLCNEISTDKPFSSSVIDKIAELYPKQTQDSPAIVEAYNSASNDIDQVFHLKFVDSHARQILYRDFIQKIHSNTGHMVSDYTNDVKSKLTDKLLELFEINYPGNELKQSIADLFKKLECFDGNYSCMYFKSLIERFNTNLIESLILMPFGSAERFSKITEKTLPEFISLSAYSSNRTASTDQKIFEPTDLLDIFCQILNHESYFDYCVSINKFFIQKFYDEIDHNQFIIPQFMIKRISENNSNISSGILGILGIFENEDSDSARSDIKKYINALHGILENKALDQSVDLLSERGVLLSVCFDDFKNFVYESLANTLEFDKIRSDKLTQDVFINDTVIQYCQRNPIMSKFSEIFKQFQISSSKKSAGVSGVNQGILNLNNLLCYLNDDIDLIRRITVNSLLNLIGMERTFIASLNNNAETLCKAIDVVEKNIFDTWINRNLNCLYPREFKSIERENEIISIKKQIVKNINELLNNIGSV